MAYAAAASRGGVEYFRHPLVQPIISSFGQEHESESTKLKQI